MSQNVRSPNVYLLWTKAFDAVISLFASRTQSNMENYPTSRFELSDWPENFERPIRALQISKA